MTDLRVISLGAGVQSSALYRMAALGELAPRPDVAIFADTQQEPPWVYENLESLRRDHGQVIPIDVATAGDLGAAVQADDAGRFASVPFWCTGKDGREAPARRQCTREFKIDVVKRAIRERLGLQPRQPAKGRFQVEEWVGITLDEAHRAKPSRYDWITSRWPLLTDRPMTRWEAAGWLERHGFPVPKKSACTFCPYRPAAEYARWREQEPELFEEVCRWDDLIRSRGAMRGMDSLQYVTRLRVPLRELPPYEELRDTEEDDSQVNLFGNECEGMCGV